MNDKELLELAAKAAGVIYKYYSEPEGLVINDDQWPLVVWNPLTDDGDALRLAVKLNIEFDNVGKSCTIYHYDIVCDEPHGDDPYAATRRAIVRAAAEIGKEVK